MSDAHGTGDAEDARAHRSRWPTIGAFGTGALYAGAGLYLLSRATGLVPAPLGLGLALAGTAGLVAGLAGWFREAFGGERERRAGEGVAGRVRTAAGEYRTGMLLVLATDVATFGAGFVYYAFVRVTAWPGDPPALLSSLVAINTVLLVASSVTLHYAHGALEAGDRRRFLGLLGATVALGGVFLAGQALEYAEFLAEGFTLASGVFGSAFYGLTGLHGLHVAAGVVMLAVVFARAVGGAYGPDRDVGVATVSLYWHFVDAVWLVLVATVYVGAALG